MIACASCSGSCRGESINNYFDIWTGLLFCSVARLDLWRSCPNDFFEHRTGSERGGYDSTGLRIFGLDSESGTVDRSDALEVVRPTSATPNRIFSLTHRASRCGPLPTEGESDNDGYTEHPFQHAHLPRANRVWTELYGPRSVVRRPIRPIGPRHHRIARAT